MTAPMKTKPISLSLKVDVIELIEKLAEQEGISKSLVVTKLLQKEVKHYINKEKNLFDF